MKQNIDIFKSFCRLLEDEFDCKLCLHDYTGMLAHGELPLMHTAYACIAYKKSIRRRHLLCIDFDQKTVHQKMLSLQKGFFKRCHCGILEAVFPVYCKGTLAGVIFAGPFASGKADLDTPAANIQKNNLPQLDDQAREKLMNMGELLASYLGNCCTPTFGTDREGRIKDYLQHNASSPHASLGELSEKLQLSPARTSEAVKKIFNCSFSHLLNAERLRIAKMYLDDTDYPIVTVAAKTGFSDGTYFHRVFKQFYGITPGEYRKKHNQFS